MIVVFGSVNADYFLKVRSFPAPGETVLTPSHIVKAGGKGGNQAVAAAKAGGKTTMIACFGKDTSADVPMTAMKNAGVDMSKVVYSDKPTALAMIMVDESGENSIVVSSGANGDLKAADVPEGLLTENTTLVMQMEVPAEENFALLKRAKQKGVRTVLNVAPAHSVPAEVLPLVDYLILNEIEAETVYRSAFGGEKGSPEKTALALAEKTKGVCLVTLGGQGALAAKDGKIVRVSCLSVKPVDTTGAGDAFVGIFSAMTDAGYGLADAMRRASAGAGLACLKTGAQEGLPTKEDIEKRCAEIVVS
jgi:ribokinase